MKGYCILVYETAVITKYYGYGLWHYDRKSAETIGKKEAWDLVHWHCKSRCEPGASLDLSNFYLRTNK